MSWSAAVGLMLPEIIIAGMACVVLLVDLYSRRGPGQAAFGLSIAALAAAVLVTAVQFPPEPVSIFGGMFVRDRLADIVKIGSNLLIAGVLIGSRAYLVERGLFRGEYFVLALFGAAGIMVMASAANLLTLYLGLELLSLCLYALVALQRDSAAATEAAMKYFVLGALASGMLLYGMSLLYGVTGTLEIAGVRDTLATMSGDDLVLVMALVFIVVSLTFKLGAVPFHMWLPDVYHGAPTASTVYVGTAPKLAAFALVLRLLIGGLEDLHDAWRDMLILVALLSIILGNLVAIAQTNIKRMLGYSTIAHMGYFLLGILAGTDGGYSAALLYVLAYAVMSLGAFGVILLMSRDGFEADRLDDYRGLNEVDPWHAFLTLILMFSLAGVPPTLGFYAKFSVILAVVDAGLVWLAVVAVIFAVVGAYYYLRVVKLMYFDAPAEGLTVRADRGLRTVVAVNALVLVLVMPWVQTLVQLCRGAIRQLAG